MTENERVKRYGFTPEELERAKKDMLTALKDDRFSAPPTITVG